MLFAFVLAVATLIAWSLGRSSADWPTHARRGLAAAMIFAGIAHLGGPEPFIQHMPAWLPAREAIVALTGIIEIGLGATLVASKAHRAAVGRLVAMYLLAIWPANIYVAVAGVDVDGQPGGPYPWIRIPFQALFIVWALWSTRAAPADPRAEPASTATATVTP